MTVAWSVVEPLSLLPSPQLMVHVQGESGMPGSLKVALTAWIWPEKMAASAPATTVGATLFTVSPKVTDDDAPSLSVAVMVVVWLSAGPSTAPRLQVQAPLLPLPWLTLPTLAVIITLSGRPGSEKVPLLAAVCPSSTVTLALFAVSVGVRLLTTWGKVTESEAPSLSVVSKVQDQVPMLPELCVMEPTLAVRVTLSWMPGSKKLPLLEAVSPSWTLVLPRLPVVRMAKVKPCQFSGVGTVQEKVLKKPDSLADDGERRVEAVRGPIPAGPQADDRHDGIDDWLRERHPVRWANVLRDAKSVEANPGRPLARPGPPQPAMNTIAASTKRTGVVYVKAILCAPWSAGEPGDGPSL